MAVLFSCLLAACAAMPTHQPPVFSSRIAWKEDYSMKTGETASVRIFALEDGSERRVTFSASGPASHDCMYGCGSLGAQVNANPGTYRIEAENNHTPGTASATFTVKDNEIWVWDIADANVDPSFRPYPEDSVKSLQAGAYRIDLFTISVVDMNAGVPPMRHSEMKRIPAHFPKGHPEARP